MPDPTRGPAALLAGVLLLAAPADAAGDEASVSVRGSHHRRFDRLTIGWPAAAALRVERRGDVVHVVLPGRERLDLADIPARLGGRILAVGAAQGRDGMELLVHVRPGTEHRLSVLPEHRVLLDVVDGAPTPDAPLAEDVAAPASEQVPPAEDLRRELRRRDLMIASLLRRVERLERGAPPERTPDDAVVETVAVTEAAPAEAPLPGPGAAEPALSGAGAPPAGGMPPPEERALERVLTRTGTVLLPAGGIELEPSLFFTHREASSPVFATAAGSPTTFIGENRVRRNELIGTLALRAGLPLDAQLELALPYRYVDQSTATAVGGAAAGASSGHGHGVGDLVVAGAKTLLHQHGWWPDLVGRAFWDTATGERSDGGVALGSGFDEIGGTLTALRRQDPLAFFVAAAYETTLERDHVDPGNRFGLQAGAALAVSPETSLRFTFDQEFVGKTELRGRSVGGSDQTLGLLSLDAATLLGRRVLLDVGVDVGVTEDAPDYVARVSLPIRFDLPVR